MREPNIDNSRQRYIKIRVQVRKVANQSLVHYETDQDIYHWGVYGGGSEGLLNKASFRGSIDLVSGTLSGFGIETGNWNVSEIVINILKGVR